MCAQFDEDETVQKPPWYVRRKTWVLWIPLGVTIFFLILGGAMVIWNPDATAVYFDVRLALWLAECGQPGLPVTRQSQLLLNSACLSCWAVPWSSGTLKHQPSTLTCASLS